MANKAKPMTTNRPLFFLWIPKTGGGTLHNAFLELGIRRHIGASWTQNPGLLGVDLGDGSDYYVGHWPASIMYRLPENCIKVTLLRDPVERVVSHYNYVHQYGYHYDDDYSEFARNATFEEWLHSHYAQRAASNLQTRFLCDRETADLDRAIEALHQFDAVGVLLEARKHYQYVMNRVCDLMFIDAPLVAGHYNVSNKDVRLDDLPSELYAELVERNAKDMALVREAKRME
jgi:hypothetical protein